jgi:hypothetical protein
MQNSDGMQKQLQKECGLIDTACKI